ncbi:chemotactic signal-response protein CheL [Ruegeria denitrificans]|uniref:Chemotactic signal-response protein CheL n=1 Tax=Ruegeria denitrificans TaxID=1715692 RepID=A0A0P1IGR2_9RHOB|nr:rod-binding protein [Ruegeria denitrificans]CUK11964.1 chemotactic signal-response protein CheL [Ruegeria denitrificans]
MKVFTTLPAAPPATTAEKLQAAAVELEAAFLAEMLKSSGLGKASESFGGGSGEDQFSSFLVQHQARALAESGGVGLSEILFQSMMEKTNADQT